VRLVELPEPSGLRGDLTPTQCDTPLAPRSFDVMALGNEGDTALAPGSSDVVALGNVALGLPGFP
jgi:hypothetical protein